MEFEFTNITKFTFLATTNVFRTKQHWPLNTNREVKIILVKIS